MTKGFNNVAISEVNETNLAAAIANDLEENKELQDKAKKQTAALLGQLDKAIKAAQNAQSGDVEDSSDVPNIFEENGLSDMMNALLGGHANFHISNGIPFDVLMDLFKSQLKTAVANISVMGSMTGGMSSAMDAVSKNTIEAGIQQSLSTTLDATGSLAQGMSTLLASGVSGFAQSKMDNSEEQGNISTLENAAREFDETPSNGQTKVGTIQGQDNRTQEIKNAISLIQSGEHDFTKANSLKNPADPDQPLQTKHRFGSVDISKDKKPAKYAYQDEEGNYPHATKDGDVYRGDDFLVESAKGPTKTTVKDAIESMTPEERRKAKENLQKKIKDAKNKYHDKEQKTFQRVTQIQQSIEKIFGNSGQGSAKMAQVQSQQAKAQNDAASQVASYVKDQNAAMLRSEGTMVDNATGSVGQTFQMLQQLITTLGRVGQ